MNNIIDNFSLTKGKHNLQFGVNWRRVDQNRTSNANSFNGASTNPYWLKGDPPQPDAVLGLNPVDQGFTNSYDIAYANLIGTVPSVTVVSNYDITSATSATLLADGTPIARHFKANEYEGICAGLMADPAEPDDYVWCAVHGAADAVRDQGAGSGADRSIRMPGTPQRETAALQGQIYEPDLTFAPAGKYYGKPGFYPENKNNFAPRLAIVYSPDAKTTFRAGAGIYYDHFGEGLINIFDQNGSFGFRARSPIRRERLRMRDAAALYGAAQHSVRE